MGNPWNTAIFDYLNNNPHKFDEYGNFNPTPDERDYLPFGMVTHPNGGWGRRPKIKKPKYAGRYRDGEGPDDVAKQRMRDYAKDYENDIHYDDDKCFEIKEFEEQLCRDGYQGRALHACLTRVDDRHTICKRDKHFNNAPDLWTAELMSGQPLGDEDIDRRRKRKSEVKSQPEASPKPENSSDESKRARSPDEMFWMMHPLLAAYLATNPKAASILHDMPAHMHDLLRRTTLVPSDFPKGMERLTPYSPPPNLGLALGGPLGPRALPVPGF